MLLVVLAAGLLATRALLEAMAQAEEMGQPPVDWA
jgi:hypothetical protein